MIIKPKEIEITKDEPFKNDALDRSNYVEVLTEFIKISNEAMVLAINSPWGTGKSTFIRMWQHQLENEGFSTFYFNAWENDFVNEPFIAFIDAFEELLKKHPNIEKFKKVGREVIKSTIPGLVKVATAGIVNLEEIALGKDAESTIISYAEKIADNQIKNYKNTKNAMKSFKKLLGEFVEEKVKEDGNKPIIFFIDELDRCRPNFAIELLEKVKHLFYTPGVVFVLSLDKSQLGNSVKSIYGNGIDVDGYLARFIDVEYSLPKADSEKFIDYLIQKFEFDKFFIDRRGHAELASDESNFIKICKQLFKIHDFSLIIQEQIFVRLSLVMKTIKKDYHIYPELLVFLICLRYSNIDIYNRIKIKNIDSMEVINSLSTNIRYREFFNNHLGDGAIIEGIIICILNDKKAENKYRLDLDKFNATGNIQGEELNKRNRINKIVSCINHCEFSNMGGVLEYVLKKVEIVDKFIYTE